MFLTLSRIKYNHFMRAVLSRFHIFSLHTVNPCNTQLTLLCSLQLCRAWSWIDARCHFIFSFPESVVLIMCKAAYCSSIITAFTHTLMDFNHIDSTQWLIHTNILCLYKMLNTIIRICYPAVLCFLLFICSLYLYDLYFIYVNPDLTQYWYAMLHQSELS